jgi:hypothetical protein
MEVWRGREYFCCSLVWSGLVRSAPLCSAGAAPRHHQRDVLDRFRPLPPTPPANFVLPCPPDRSRPRCAAVSETLPVLLIANAAIPVQTRYSVTQAGENQLRLLKLHSHPKHPPERHQNGLRPAPARLRRRKPVRLPLPQHRRRRARRPLPRKRPPPRLQQLLLRRPGPAARTLRPLAVWQHLRRRRSRRARLRRWRRQQRPQAPSHRSRKFGRNCRNAPDRA